MATFDIYYKYGFEWDPRKATSNLNKHGVSFEEGATVFDDPNLIDLADTKHSTVSEIRGWAIGLSDFRRQILVVYTQRSAGKTRIISARRLNRRERKRIYEK